MRSRKGTFSGEGQLLNFEDEPTIEGFVMMKGTYVHIGIWSVYMHITYI